ncbi:hypothetical protein PSN45_001500 [Yamadazyma tenuis]|uniref:1,3-beta-glucanosyltransferase n=1 Tax=Candida tenuis (strain ATCC 10573 / BCRC 21748 / CBS 615 / JCM 9827 / NBRC 10315 / NRRL Y-1498 / VKM Y-70) TaxID=590646 RepID=G3BFR0_CANTC|nr:uncharacterized protein CANTEDRAFT_128231 [Yamadazyma tenuis ATCC 10573]EGV60712.1 hypothetical protein CANTEDRAFT_128231 [Yamadazyma tenuis ATCC 10573]WEJ94023.1 hypothetical protein PSN45_001500 [Yamadazyma tenuis]
MQFFIIFIYLSLGVVLASKRSGSSSPKDISTIKVIGNKFVNEKGYQFYIKGIAYQKSREQGDNFQISDGVGYIDPLANSQTCLRDLEYLEKLNINVVRVYHIDPNKNHDACMNAFATKGIYVLCDLPEPETSINRNNPAWDIDLYDRYSAVIDSMHNYKNVLGFIAGNEVTNTIANVDASPFVKAAIRDAKKYIHSKGYRKIPVGYTANDDSRIRTDLSNYFVCGDEEWAKADFFGLNMYEWCGYSTYTTSGYRDRTLEYLNFQTPIFFSEFGCNTINPRPFTEIEALYGLTMSKVWSGGIAYEYFQHERNYGVVQENPDGSVTALEDFYTLSMRFGTNSPKIIKVTNETTPINSECLQSKYWHGSEKLPQTPDRGKCECLQSTLSCIMTPFQEVKEQELLNEVCTKVDCSEITANGELGKYGALSDCSLNQRVSFSLNKFYKQNGSKESECSFDKRAVLVSNNDQYDIKTITVRDGRTCEEALEGVKDLTNPNKDIYEKHLKEMPNGEFGFSKEPGNHTDTTSSNGSSGNSIGHLVASIMLFLVLKYFI